AGTGLVQGTAIVVTLAVRRPAEVFAGLWACAGCSRSSRWFGVNVTRSRWRSRRSRSLSGNCSPALLALRWLRSAATTSASISALLNGKSPGQPCKLNDLQRRAIAGMIESGPIPAVPGVVRWRLIDLAQWIFEEFRIAIAKQTLSRELRAMGYRKLSARPRHHAQAQGAIEDFKKAFPCAWRKSRAPRRSTATR